MLCAERDVGAAEVHQTRRTQGAAITRTETGGDGRPDWREGRGKGKREGEIPGKRLRVFLGGYTDVCSGFAEPRI